MNAENIASLNSIKSSIGSILISTKIYDQNDTNIKCVDLFNSSDFESAKKFVVENWGDIVLTKIEQHLLMFFSLK